MPYHDLNVPWTEEPKLERTLAFMSELGYDVVALSHTITGSLQGDLSCKIPSTISINVPESLRLLKRCTLTVSDPSQNYRLSELAENYDLVALRPTNEKSLMFAATSQHCDIISLDLTQRMDFYPKIKTICSAVEQGIAIELCYASAVLTSDAHVRRNVISNATSLIRAARGRGLIISSEATRAAGCRGPQDVINLAAVWGLGQEKGKEALDKLARSTVINAQLRKHSFRGAITVVSSGPKVEQQREDLQTKRSEASTAKKRKADTSPSTHPVVAAKQELNVMPLSKREQKRRKKAAMRTDQSS